MRERPLSEERTPRPAGFGAMLRTSLVLCLVATLLVLAAFAAYQIYRWLF